MEHSLKPPSELNIDSSGNLVELWKAWKNDFQIYLQATESSTKSDLVKIVYTPPLYRQKCQRNLPDICFRR